MMCFLNLSILISALTTQLEASSLMVCLLSPLLNPPHPNLLSPPQLANFLLTHTPSHTFHPNPSNPDQTQLPCLPSKLFYLLATCFLPNPTPLLLTACPVLLCFAPAFLVLLY